MMDPNLKEMLQLFYTLGLNRGYVLGQNDALLARALGNQEAALPTDEEATEAFEELLNTRPDVAANLARAQLVRA